MKYDMFYSVSNGKKFEQLEQKNALAPSLSEHVKRELSLRSVIICGYYFVVGTYRMTLYNLIMFECSLVLSKFHLKFNSAYKLETFVPCRYTWI